MTVQVQLGAARMALVEGTRIFAGRDPSACNLSHSDPTLSRRHAEIWFEKGELYLRDLGSANGTWVDGRGLGPETVALAPGNQIWLGHVSLDVAWIDGRTSAPQQAMPAELVTRIAERKTKIEQAQPEPAGAGMGSTPLPADLAYRKQGSNDNGVILLALKQDTHWSGATIDGYVEFTALDTETVASITVELVEIHRRKAVMGQSWEKQHVWDRVLVRQGPWKAQHNDVLPLPFSLRVAAGTSMSTQQVSWEIRGYVDINWASDIEVTMPITMRNPDIERLRDAMGAMDYRVGDVDSTSAGQRFEAQFAPPPMMASQWGVNSATLVIEYLGANLKVSLQVDRKGVGHNPAVDHVFELGRLRAATQPEVNATLKQMLDGLLK